LWHGLPIVPLHKGLPCGIIFRICGRPTVAKVARSGDRATTGVCHNGWWRAPLLAVAVGSGLNKGRDAIAELSGERLRAGRRRRGNGFCWRFGWDEILSFTRRATIESPVPGNAEIWKRLLAVIVRTSAPGRRRDAWHGLLAIVVRASAPIRERDAGHRLLTVIVGTTRRCGTAVRVPGQIAPSLARFRSDHLSCKTNQGHHSRKDHGATHGFESSNRQNRHIRSFRTIRTSQPPVAVSLEMLVHLAPFNRVPGTPLAPSFV
jgi:hypothetical protein